MLHKRIFAILFACFPLFLSFTSNNALAFCGFFAGKADANLFNEASQVILVRDGTRSVISMLNGKVEQSHLTDQHEFYQMLDYEGDVDLRQKLG